MKCVYPDFTVREYRHIGKWLNKCVPTKTYKHTRTTFTRCFQRNRRNFSSELLRCVAPSLVESRKVTGDAGLYAALI